MDDTYQDVCRVLVRAGLVVFAFDPTGQGERSNFWNSETKTYDVGRTCPDHDTVGVPAVATGRFLQRFFICDEQRAIDYMCSRPEIDPERIGVTGNSGGGTQTLAIMTVDDRLKAAAPGTFVTNRRAYMYTGQAQDSEQWWPDMTEYGFDHVNPFMIFAPKPANILATRYDFFPIEGTVETYNEAKRVYGILGAEDNMRITFDNYIHKYTLPLAQAAAAFFTEVLGGEAVTVSTDDLGAFTEQQMYATPTGQVSEAFADNKRIIEEVRGDAELCRSERFSFPDSERLARARVFLSEKVYAHRLPTADFYPRIFPKSACMQVGGYMGITCSWWAQKKLFNYGVMIKRECDQDIEPTPVTLCVWTDGSKMISAHEGFIKEEIARGRQVFVLDVSGVGAIEQRNMILNAPYKDRYGTLFTLASMLLYSGDSMAAERTYGVLRAIEMLEKEFGVAESDIEIYSEGAEGIYGVMAAFLKPDMIARYGEGLLSVERDVIFAKPFLYDNTLPLLIPGMLHYFDYNDLIR